MRRIGTAAAAALLLLAGHRLQAQVVHTWEGESGGVVSSMAEGTITGDEYAAAGIIEDWSSVLRDFETFQDDGRIDEDAAILSRTDRNVTVMGRNEKKYVLPSIIDKDGTDLFLLTRDGIQIYMALDAPAYLQDTDEEIVKWIRFYAVKRKAWTAKVFSRYEKWEAFIKNTFAAKGVPTELGELCLIESGCTTTALSSAGAYGMWQIMPETGRHHGLVVGLYRDDRADPLLATPAAADILRSNYRILGDWTLAAAAYNCGAGRVQKGRGKTWESVRPTLPTETKKYIPGLLAMHYVWTYRKQLGFN